MMHLMPKEVRIIKRQDGIYKPMLTIRHAGKDDLNPDTCSYIASLVNLVYGQAEAEFWKPDTSSRTTAEEIHKFIDNGDMLIAELDGILVGVCKIGLRDGNIAEFGMLCADPKFRNIGIGRDMVEFAENWGREKGAKQMRLELLTPRVGENASKEFLKKWYSRIGYKPSESTPFEEVSPHRMDDFAIQCDFTVWLKDL